jgi:transposase
VSDSLLFSSDKDAQIASLQTLLALRDAALAEAKAELLHRDLLIETMRVQLARLRRMQFGASSEKLSQEIEQLELALEELEAATVEVAQTSSLPPKPERPVPVRSLPEHLPREDVVAEPPSGTCACPDCGGILRKLSEDSAEQLDVAPVRWRVVRTIRPKYSCRVCEKIVQAPAPVKAVARGKATFATLAHVIVAKFDHHLPLYRQSEMMAAQGVDIDRSTLAGWTGQASALLDPIISRIREEGAKASKIHTDDTPVPVLDPGRGKTATGRLWTYVVDDRASGSATPPLAWYRFTPDRTGAHPQKACHRSRLLGPFPAQDIRYSQAKANHAHHRYPRTDRSPLCH